MQITELVAPTDGASLFTGKATSTRGRRYLFSTIEGEPCGVFREDPASGVWWQIKAPLALKKVVRSRCAAGTHG